jgi:parvulin-like peptidyl-prolyl isomerase
MSTMAVPVPAVASVRIAKPAPWTFALVGAFAVAVVAGGSVAATQAVLGDRLDSISSQVDEQSQRADVTQAKLTAVQGQLNSESAIATRRADAAAAEIAALRSQLAVETARSAKAEQLILTKVSTLRRR